MNDVNKLKKNCKKGLENLLLLGRDHFLNDYIPLVKRVESLTQEKLDELLGDAYYLMGDLYDVINLPLQSLESYKKGIKYCSNDFEKSSFYREIGHIYVCLGNQDIAIDYLLRALSCHDDMAEEELFNVLEYGIGDSSVYGDDSWQIDVAKNLLSGLTQKVLQQVRKIDNIDARYFELVAHAAEDDLQAVRRKLKSKTVKEELLQNPSPFFFYASKRVLRVFKFQRPILGKVF